MAVNTVSVPRNGRSHQIDAWSYVSAGRRSRRASKMVEMMAMSTSGPMMSGWSDMTHSRRRAAKNCFVYGGGRAASARLADVPQMPTTHIASPPIIPKPTDISMGPSARSADPNENLLVRKWKPNTAKSTTPKITHVVGCVNAAATAIRKSAVRAPHDVRAAWRKGSVSDSRNRTVMLSR